MNILNENEPIWIIPEDFENTIHRSIIRMW